MDKDTKINPINPDTIKKKIGLFFFVNKIHISPRNRTISVKLAIVVFINLNATDAIRAQLAGFNPYIADFT